MGCGTKAKMKFEIIVGADDGIYGGREGSDFEPWKNCR
jgi:hypothetical protein